MKTKTRQHPMKSTRALTFSRTVFLNLIKLIRSRFKYGFGYTVIIHVVPQSHWKHTLINI